MFYVIINPASKSGRGVSIWKELEPIMTEQGIDHKVIYSDHIGHIEEIVRRLCEKLDTDSALELNIVILGGDGTINEAIQGVSHFDRVRIGYIPTGSSNDLARDLGYSKDPKEMLAKIVAGKTKRTMDFGVLTYKNCYENDLSVTPVSRRFLTSTGMGFDAAVCAEALQDGSKKLLNKLGLGKLTYVTIALKHILAAKSVSCELTLDHERVVTYNRFLFIAAMNHRYEGGGFMFCPEAVDNDGILDMCVVGDLPKYKMLMALPTAFKGKHFRFKNIDPYKASHIEIKSSTPLWVHTDGEVYYQSNHIEITCEAGKLQFLA